MRRRTFMSAGVGTAAMALLLHGTAEATARSVLAASGVPAPSLRRATFESWRGTSFYIRPLGALRATRAALVGIESGPAVSGLEQFQLLFRSRAASLQGLCAVQHASSGAAFYLHLEQAQRNGPGGLSRATFCLMTAA